MNHSISSAKAAPKAKPDKAQTLSSAAWRVMREYLAPFKFKAVLAIIASLVVAACTGGFTFLLGPATDKLFAAHPAAGAIIYIPLAMVALAGVRAGATVVQTWTMNTIGNLVVGQMQVDLFGGVIRSDLARLRASHSGSIVSSVLYDAGLVRVASTIATLNFVREGVTLLALLGVLFFRDAALTLAILFAGPLIVALTRRFTRWTKKAATGAMSETSSLSSTIMEGIDGIKVVKIDGREAYEQARFTTVVNRRQGYMIKGSNIGAALAPSLELIWACVIAGVVCYAGWRHAEGHMTAGAFFSFLASLIVAGQSLRQLANSQPTFAEGFTAAQRIFAVIDAKPQIFDAPNAKVLEEPARGLAFDNVGFAYHGQDDATIEGVSLTVARGETVALVGPSGGGKSTILNLIARFYDVTYGAVTIDGDDVRSLALSSLREQIGLVTQEPFLFDDTIAANIAYPRPDATRAEIEAAAREAAAHDFIVGFPNGYDTPVGEAGSRLSGGQRQRIAIARVFLKNAPILLLDEATSALDTESETQVQAALERLMAGRATILIAHRLSTVKDADRIYVIDKGRVVETGTHGELVRARGLYSRLARAQDLDTAPEAAE